jgi:hypothetical protein
MKIMERKRIGAIGKLLVGLAALVPTGCSQAPEIRTPGIKRDANYLVEVAGEGVYVRAFDKDGLQSVRVTTPDGKQQTLYKRNGNEIDYKIFTPLSPEGKIQRGLYTLDITDIFGETETITTHSNSIEKAPHPHWASP